MQDEFDAIASTPTKTANGAKERKTPDMEIGAVPSSATPWHCSLARRGKAEILFTGAERCTWTFTIPPPAPTGGGRASPRAARKPAEAWKPRACD
jgi:hypothetical protein